MGCDRRRSRPRHPQGQGLVEQGNGTLEAGLQAVLQEQPHLTWKEALPRAVMRLNMTKHSTTKFTPFKLVFGIDPPYSQLEKYLGVYNTTTVVLYTVSHTHTHTRARI